jgi:uncharacterized protein
MPIRDGREYRSFQLDTSAEDDNGYTVEGYATTFGTAYEMGRGYFERIDPHALDDADMSDIIFQLNHQGTVLARQRNRTLEVECDQHGIRVRADLGGSQAGRDLHESIKNGLIDRMSWGFTVADDGWEYDADTRTSTITKVVKVYDVSAVSIPANDGTEIHARSYLDGVIENERRESAQREEQQERERIRATLEIY